MGVTILISDKIDFKIKNVIKDKEGLYVMTEGSIQQEDIIFINIYTANIAATKYIKQILTELNGELDMTTIIIEDFNTRITSMDRSSKQKTNTETLALNDTLE